MVVFLLFFKGNKHKIRKTVTEDLVTEISDLIFLFSPLFLVLFTVRGWSSITVTSITKLISLSPGQITEKEGFTLIRKGILLIL